MNKNANVEAKDFRGFTPLMRGKILNELKKKFIDRILLLFIASWNGYIEIVRELLNKNANVEAKDDLGFTPLMLGLFLNEKFIFNSLF